MIKISDISSKNDGALVSIKGVLKNVQECVNISKDNEKWSNNFNLRRTIMIDDGEFFIWVTLFGTLAESFKFKINDLIELNNFKVNIYDNTKSLNSLIYSKINVLEEKNEINVELNKSIPLDGFVNVSYIQESASLDKKYCWIKGNVLSFQESFYYSCFKCKKKSDDKICIKCNENKKMINMRLVWYIDSNDGGIGLKIICFDQCIEHWFSESIESLNKERDHFFKKRDLFIGKCVAARIGYSLKSYNDYKYLEVISYTVVCLKS